MDKNDNAMTKGGSQKLKNLEGEAHDGKWKITRDNKTWTNQDIMYKTKRIKQAETPERKNERQN